MYSWGNNAKSEDELALRQRVEQYVWRTRWVLIGYGVLLIFILRSPPLWVSLTAVCVATLNNAILRRLLINRGRKSQLQQFGAALFLLDAALLLIGLWPMIQREDKPMQLFLLVIPLEATSRLGFEKPVWIYAGMALLAIYLSLYILANLRNWHDWRDVMLWVSLYAFVAFWEALVARALWRSQQNREIGPPVPPTLRPVVMDSKTGRVRKLLTAQQQEVLRQMASGLNNREIADRLSLSQETVRGHIKGIYRQLDVHHREDALQRARTLGYIDADKGSTDTPTLRGSTLSEEKHNRGQP